MIDLYVRQLDRKGCIYLNYKYIKYLRTVGIVQATIVGLETSFRTLSLHKSQYPKTDIETVT